MENILKNGTEIESIDNLEIGETVYQNDSLSVEGTNLEDIYYVCVSADKGLSFEFKGYYRI